MPRVSLNIDLGELPGEPDELYAAASVVNIACGGHAGDLASMTRAIELATKSGATLAAHPSYPDRTHFGRKSLSMDTSLLRESVASQCALLKDAARRAGQRIERVKPHGALYHDATTDRRTAEALLEGAREGLGTQDIELCGAPVGMLFDLATERSVRYAREGFADRTYRSDGGLVPRTQPDALITDPALAAAQAVRLAATGQFDTLCVHADTPDALSIARAVRQALAAGGFFADPA
jgi:UPF0271 protein